MPSRFDKIISGKNSKSSRYTQTTVYQLYPFLVTGYNNQLSLWCKKILEQAGIPTKFSLHSTRSASALKAFARGLSVVDICKAADWTTEGTFAKFYIREIIIHLGERILDNC